MDKFEYCVLFTDFKLLGGGVYEITPQGEKLKVGDKSDAVFFDGICQQLNRLGNDGWEVCGFASYLVPPGQRSERAWTLKRKIQNKNE